VQYELKPIRELCSNITSGGTPSRRVDEYYCNDGTGHPWVKSKELLDRSIATTEETITDLGLKKSSAKYIPANSVLIAMYGANVGQLGWLRRPATVNQAICALVVDPCVADFRYVFYVLLLHRDALISLAQGAAQQNLNQDTIKYFQIPFVNIDVQHKIAAIISAYDDLIENNTLRIIILEEIARSIYREWFVNFRFPGHEKVRMVDSKLGKIPEGWNTMVLGDIAKDIRRNVQPSAVTGDTPYFGLEHLPRKSIALSNWGTASEVQSTKLLISSGDILFGKIRPYFHKVGVSPVAGVCSSDIIVVAPLAPEYFGIVLECVSSSDFIDHATQTSQGTKMPRANWDILIKYPLVLPSEDILKEFNSNITDIVSLINVLIFKNINLRNMRDLLLPRLISSELNVSELDIAIDIVTAGGS
jgi:type I restriction enzyme S subunit